MRFLLFTAFYFTFLGLQAQSKQATKATALVQEAMLLETGMDMASALKLYRKAVKVDPTLSLAWYQLGVALRKNAEPTSEQVTCFKNVVVLDSNSKNGMNSIGNLSAIYNDNGIFDTSLYYYKRYINHEKLHPKRKEQALASMPNREFAAKSYKHPLKIDPWPLHNWINEENSLQYFPILTGDEKKMLFTRRNKGSQNEDLYISLFLGDWQEPDKLPGTINSHESEGTATISADGTTIVCSYCGDLRENFGNCDLYYSTLKGNKWSKLKNLGADINSEAYESQPSLSADGRTLYFVSDREGGIGGLDIYVSHKIDENHWDTPVNLGSLINTEENEGSPFFHPNGVSLFFASKGHVGMGGYDLFLSEMEEGKWTEPRNLGYPINDQNNQLSLFVNATGDKGYFSKEEFSDQSMTSNQSRIWTFDVPPELKLGHRSNYVHGKVFDNITKKPIEASLKLVNIETDQTIGQVSSNLLNGKYLVMLAEGAEYAFYAETPGYLFKSISFNYKEKRDFEPIELDIFLDPIIKGITVQLNNIYFETGKAVLLNKSRTELNKLYQLMVKNPTLNIELGGHTDNVGSDETNLTLSQKRVDAVKTYLVKKGIPSSRMTGVGYGESKPKASNDSAQGRKQNRRVEFTVM
ncbi:MAG: hypothetical protein CL840_07785 [Crocinitomicaceae bacterium]|nr:hypothetical protein [Crocinitomicaceae bacterium]|tara:strand:+ start:144 stop:2054 length:1911 start_codon:yes stop_codon:yes gene_type:complete